MAGGYSHDPKGIDGVVAMVRDLQRQIDAIRGSAGIKSAVLRGDQFEFQNPDGNAYARLGIANVSIRDPDTWLSVDADIQGLYLMNNFGGAYYAYIIESTDPIATRQAYFDLDLFASYYSDRFLVQRLGGAGNVVMILDEDSITLDSDISGGSVSAQAEKIVISSIANEVGVYGIPTTSNPANVHLGTVGGKWTLARVTSSRRFKTDIDTAVIEPREVLSIEPRTWIDKGDVAAAGTMVPRDGAAPGRDDQDVERVPFIPPRQIGFIAEEAYERETLQQFVGLDEAGLPQSFDYDRFASVGLHAVCKAQQAEIDDLKSTVASLESRLESLESRLESLESRA